MKQLNVGIIGCGNISDIYLTNLTKVFRNVKLKACADLMPERSQAKAEQYGILSVTPEALLADPEISIVINLTIPKAHAAVTSQILRAGKHVYQEKPFATTREDGKQMLKLAQELNLRIGCAPDTFLGGGLQTCRKLLDDGWIGTPVGATAFMACHGHESWHPDPEFYYEVGGGPMLDMGPYYLTALISMLGPVNRVAGSCKVTFPERTITSEKKYGKTIQVEVPTHVTGLLEFEQGTSAMIMTTFDVWSANLPRIEIYGSEGTLSVPDPNTFGGPVLVKRKNHADWMEIPLTHGYAENSRGIGVADMARAIMEGDAHRADMTLANHVLDVMFAVHDASDAGKTIVTESTCVRPEALPLRDLFR